MMSNPDISVILPVHDNRQTLPAAVQSIIDQTFSNWELIIVADGSPAEVMSLLNNISDPRVKTIPIKHSGISKAINIGIRHARADIIARMDADDISMPDRLRLQHGYLIENPGIGLVASRVMYQGMGDGFRRFVNWQNGLLTQEEMFEARFQDAIVAHPSVMFRKKLIFQYGGYNEARDEPEDFELWLRFLQSGVKFAKLPQELLIWSDGHDRLSRDSGAYAEMNFWKVKCRYLSAMLRNDTRDIYVIGKGSRVNEKIKHLETHGIRIGKKVDVKPHPGNPLFMTYDEVSSAKNAFYLSLVRDPEGREQIRKFLNANGLKSGRDYLLME